MFQLLYNDQDNALMLVDYFLVKFLSKTPASPKSIQFSLFLHSLSNFDLDKKNYKNVIDTFVHREGETKGLKHSVLSLKQQ